MNRSAGWLALCSGLVAGTGPLVSVWSYADDEQDRNHPEVRWVTSETKHFRFHYERRLRPVAEACAQRAEAVYPEVTELLGHAPPGKVDFLVFDEDYSNGWAIASLNTMAIWSADLGFEFRGTKDWIRDVVAHEFAHVVSIQKSAKVKPWLPELQFGWSDGSDKPVASGGWVLWSLNPYSMSMAEGTAQWTSERMGGDRWDTHRRMITRTAALSDSLLPWSKLSVFSGTGLDYERVYGHGYGIVRDIALENEPAAVRAWWESLGRPLVQTPDQAWKAASGTGTDSLWRRWQARMKAQAEAEKQAAMPLVEGRRIFGDAFNTQHPRWWDDSTLFFSSNRGSDYQVNSLWGCDFRQTDTAKRFWTVSPVLRSRFSIDTARRTIWFHSGRNDDKHGRPVLDIYSTKLHRDDEGRWEAEKKDDQMRVTKSMHAFAPAVHGDSLAVVVRDRRAFRVRILPADGLELPATEGADIFPRPDSLGDWPTNTIFSAVWHPDGKRLAIDWFDGNRRRVDLVDLRGNILAGLGDSLSEWRDPAFSADGGSVWLSSDRTGIFNIYKQDLSSMTLEQVTSVVGGAFQPAPSFDGRRLAYSGWTQDGFGLHLLDSVAPFPLRAAEPRAVPVPAPEGSSWDLASLERPYSSIPNRFLLSPILYAQRNPPLFGDEGRDWKWMAGARFQMLDPVRRNIVYMLGLLDLTNGFDYVGPSHQNFVNPRQEKLFVAGIENRSLPPTLTAEVSYQGLRGEDEIHTEDSRHPGDSIVSFEPWALHQTAVSVGARYSLTRNQKIHANLRWAGYDFDYYEYPFRFQGYNGFTPSMFWTWYSRSSEGDESPRGTFARVEYSADIADLKRQGSFSEVFQQNANGSLTVRMTESVVHRVMLDLRAGFGNPLWDDHTIEADASVSGVAGWESEADTLDDFYLEGLSLPGYPVYLPSKGSSEERLFQGRRTAVFSLSYKAPLWKIRKLAGIWFVDTWSAGVSVYAGRAWSDGWFDGRLVDQIEDYARSVAWETRLSGTLQSAYPFQLYTRFARALDEPQRLSQRDATIDIGSLEIPTGAHRIEFGINLGLDEWAIIDQPHRYRATVLPAPARVSVAPPEADRPRGARP